jgi:hypothetical protein
MRIASAWLLLALVLSNWVGGFLCFEIRHFIEWQHEMNAVEQIIAQEVQATTGVKSAVKTLEAEPYLRGDVYGDAAFATEIAGEAVHYTLIDEHQAREVTQASPPASSNDDHSILLKSLFQEFEIIEPTLVFSSALTPLKSNFHFASFFSQSHITTLAPPPNMA